MGRRIPAWAAAGLLALCILSGAEQAEAYLIYTAPPEDVVPHASHVVRVALPRTADGFTVEHVYRGTVEPGPLRVLGMPLPVWRVLRRGEIVDFWDRKRKSKAVSMILALKETDTSLYRKGVAVLRALCLRQMHNEAVDGYWALKRNGEELVVREIDAAWAKMEAKAREGSGREAVAAKAQAPPAPAPDAGGDSEAETPRPRLAPRIEVGDRRKPAAGDSSPRAKDEGGMPVSLLLVIVGLAGLAAVAIVFVIRRRSRER